MTMNVSNILSAYQNAGANGEGISSAAIELDKSTESFSDVLSGFVSETIESVKKGEEMAAQGAVGKADMQDVILAVSEAETMMHAMTVIRDKVISAYQEVIRTSI